MQADGSASLIEQEKHTFDNSKLLDLGFVPKINLEDGMHEIFDYLEKTRNA